MTDERTFSNTYHDTTQSWLRIWGITGVVVLSSVIGLELFARAQGVERGIDDQHHLWASAWSDAKQGGSTSVVFLGTSRTQTGIATAQIESPRGHQFYNLAINDANPIPVLEYIARDPEFVGHVVYEYHPSNVYAAMEPKLKKSSNWLKQQDDLAISEVIEGKLQVIRATYISSLSPQMNLKALMRSARSRRAIHKSVTMTVDRHVVRKEPLKTIPPETFATLTLHEKEAQEQAIERIDRATRTIRERGGKVTFFRPPTQGAFGDAYKRLAPRDTHYEPLKQRIGGEWIHFEDDPALSAIETYDGQHFNKEMAYTLTRRLVELLPLSE